MSNIKDRIPNRADWNISQYNNMIIDDKDRLIRKYYDEELVEILAMFKYDNLPKTIDERTLELFILGGYALLFMKDGKVYNGVGNMGGRLDYRYIPDTATLTNTYLNYSNTLKVVTPLNIDDINEDNREEYVVVIANDKLYYGLIDALREYAEFQAECDLTLKSILYNLRIPYLCVTDSTTVKDAFDVVYSDIISGRKVKAVMGSMLKEALSTYPMDNGVQGRIKEVIELKQYKKAQFENRYGLGTNYNMKRESLTDREVDADSDTLLPSPDEMLAFRREGLELLNKAFRLNISVDFDSAWKIRREAIEINLENAENENNENAEEVDVNVQDENVEGNNRDS